MIKISSKFVIYQIEMDWFNHATNQYYTDKFICYLKARTSMPKKKKLDVMFKTTF